MAGSLTYATLADGRLLLMSHAMPEMALWDHPLPVDLDDPRTRFEVSSAAKEHGVQLGEIRKALKRAQKRGAD